MLHARLTLVLPFLLAPGTAGADFQLADDDRVVFFGDTLVEDQFFTQFVETFVRVRYPQLQTSFINSGVSGQSSADGLRRLERDLAHLQPTQVVVCYGLHDPDFQPLDPTRLTAFRRNYQEILDGLSKLCAKAILITPPRPQPDRLRLLGVPNYHDVVGHYAKAIQELGQARNLPVIDWYASSAHVDDHDDEQTRKAGRHQQHDLRPSKVAHAMVAAQLLEHWQAEPILVELTLDWTLGTAQVTRGSANVLDSSPATLSVALSNLPLPWPLPKLRASEEGLSGWPGSELCRFILRIDHLPEAGVHLAWRSKHQFPLEATELAQGMNIVHLQPIRSSRELRELQQQIDKKHRWRYHRLVPRRPEEPELQEAYDTYVRAMRLYEDGTEKIILRLPKTFDTVLQFRANSPPQAGAATGPGE